MGKSNKAVICWLYLCAASVVVMMLIGALTRLTESGLSIAVWEPFSGALPPMSHEEWVRYFEIYKQTPEYKKINSWMKLENFQGIFWLEYLHRLWGRAIGLIFSVPMGYFYFRKQISGRFALKMFLIFCLGGLQGLMGWVMVQSGLEQDALSVSHYRLTAHLLIAVLILGLLMWTIFNLQRPTKIEGRNCLATIGKIIVGMVVLMMILGGFVAGKDAGFAYNTFPLMDGKFIPNGIYRYDPWWKNHLENGIMIQWQHRIFAYILTAAILTYAFLLVKKSFANMNSAMTMVIALILQVALGISTLLSFGTYADFGDDFAYHKVLHLPVILGALHQLGAVILFTAVLKSVHKLTHRS